MWKKEAIEKHFVTPWKQQQHRMKQAAIPVQHFIFVYYKNNILTDTKYNINHTNTISMPVIQHCNWQCNSQ